MAGPIKEPRRVTAERNVTEAVKQVNATLEKSGKITRFRAVRLGDTLVIKRKQEITVE